jgi:hypothetical protein
MTVRQTTSTSRTTTEPIASNIIEETNQTTIITSEAENKKVRLQFDFTKEALRRLDETKEKLGLSTRALVVRNALRLYQWFVNEIDPESTIQITNPKGEVVALFKVKLLLE